MPISSFYLRNRKKLLFYLIGLVLISALLYFTILRHSGYIYYWDLSGAFDFRDPFGQYFKLFTSWDASNVGLRDRLPLVSLIYLIYLPFKALGFGNEIVIKIAITLLFLGCYTTIYFLAPKLVKLFCKDNVEKQGGIYVWALLIALVYAFIPFYAYRVSQLHLFYMSVFYPIQIFLFLKLLNSEKLDFKTVTFFVITMFFGLTTPNILIFDLFTFGIFFGFKFLSSLRHLKRLIKPVINLVIAAVLVVVTNFYWLVPYFVSGSPEPGYVVNNAMVAMLSQGATIGNFLLGQADWFVNQSNLGILDNGSTMYIIQILGCIVFYAVGIYGLVRHIRREYILPFVILLITAPLLVLDIFPFHDALMNALVYSPFGWVFREVNRLSFLWYFWMFVLFALGAYAMFESILLDGKVRHILKIIVLPAIFLPFFIYIFSVNVKFFEYLKPVEIDGSIKSVYKLLEDDNDYFSVYYFPQRDAYSIPWMADKFSIADSEEYKLLAYNSPKPPVDISSVIPNGKTSQGMLTDYLFEEEDLLPELSSSLAGVGVKYVVIRKGAEPINQKADYVRSDIIYPMYLYLENNNDFENVLENDYYIVFKNNAFKSVVASKQNAIYTYSSFNILEHLDANILESYDIRFCNFEENITDCQGAETTNVFLKYKKDTNYFMDFLSKEDQEKYGYYLYDNVFEQGIGVDWGRASYYDKVNGELHNVFRNYDIHAWNFNLVDKVVYSDLSFKKKVEEKDNTHASAVSFNQTSTCDGECNVFAYVLYNHIGGKLEITVNGKVYNLDTKNDFEQYQWVDFGALSLVTGEEIKFSIKNSEGVSSLGGIVILPKQVVSELKLKMVGINFVDVSESAVLDSAKLSIYKDNCNISSYGYTTGFVPKLTLQTNCLSSSSLYLRNYNSDFLISAQGDSFLNTNIFKNVSVYNATSEIWFIGIDNMFSVFLFVFGILIVAFLLILY